MPSRAIVIVDVQPEFCDTSKADEIYHALNGAPELDIWATVFKNPDPSLYRTRLDWHGAGDVSGPHASVVKLNPRVYIKQTYSMPEEMLQDFSDYHSVALCGVDIDACILAMAFQLWDQGICPIVLRDLSWTSAKSNMREYALQIIARQFGPCQIQSIQEWLS